MGLAVESGDAEHAALVARGGRLSLPLEDANVFHYVDPSGVKYEAVGYCTQYLEVIKLFFAAVDRGAWR
jgi:hypothetical protein